MEFEYTATMWVELSDIEEMLKLCHQGYPVSKLLVKFLLVGKIIIIMRLTIFFLSWLRNWNAVWKLKGVDVND